jgi:hypothetical protein
MESCGGIVILAVGYSRREMKQLMQGCQKWYEVSFMKAKLGTKPFFEGQATSCPCGCYYPYSTRIGDDPFGNRLIYCVNHGFFILKIEYFKSIEEAFRYRGRKFKFFPRPKRTILYTIPTMAWRRKEQKRMEKG